MAAWLACCVALAAGCRAVDVVNRHPGPAGEMASARGWHAERIRAPHFDLLARWPSGPGRDAARDAGHDPGHDPGRDDELWIYIEGDGLAWVSRSRPALDPTPRDPVALRLALAQPHGNAAWLARPCQYVVAATGGCTMRNWTSDRFAPEVIVATSHALDVLKRRFGASRLTLVGYSGGGAVALLLAARRDDVARVVTVAGNVDPRAWAAHHAVDPLAGSLDPVDALRRLAGVRQWHFAGGRDRVVPPSLVAEFAARFPAGQRPTTRVIAEFDHHCCWVEGWPALFRAIVVD